MLRRAMRVAEASDFRFRHGAVIVKSGASISVGINRSKNHPDLVEDPKSQSSVHAEVAAIRAARGANLKGATIYIARILQDGSPAMSKPCDNCVEALRKAGIKKVFYTVEHEMDLT